MEFKNKYLHYYAICHVLSLIVYVLNIQGKSKPVSLRLMVSYYMSFLNL